MTNIFNLENLNDFSEKIDMDELYEKKKQHDLNQLELFNKILNRIHVRIKTTSRQKINEQFCWYVIPEYILGVPKYDQASCIAYIIDKLTTNGFQVKYIHPNTILISWKKWVPSYVRDEMKKKTGIVINEFGERVDTEQNKEKGLGVVTFSNRSNNSRMRNSVYEEEDPNAYLFDNDNDNDNERQLGNRGEKGKKSYKSTNSYKPSGKLIYNEDFFPQNIEDL